MHITLREAFIKNITFEIAFIINLLAPKRQINAVMFHITEGLLRSDSIMQTKNRMCFGKSLLPFNLERARSHRREWAAIDLI